MKIIFEDEQILVVDKPSGLTVNRSETAKEETLQDQLVDYFGLRDLGIGDRAGVVHRLDRETSGLLVVAKTQKAFDQLQAQFKDRQVKKEYIALVHGHLVQMEGSIDAPILRIGKFGKFGVAKGRDEVGREARTDYKVEGYYSFDSDVILNLIQDLALTKSRINYLKQNASEYCLLSLFPKTGRTHQIRVHLKSIGHPVVSDLIYGPGKLVKFDLSWCPRLFLHAAKIEFAHPATKKVVVFKSVLPKDLKNAMLFLASRN